MRVYFDNAATTPISAEVLDVMTKTMQELYGNPSSIHSEGRLARTAIEKARKTVANCLKASIGEIFFTSGGTESNNMAIKCAVRDWGVRRIISSPIEHHCVLHTIESFEHNPDVEIVMVKVDKKGHFDMEHLETLLSDTSKKTLVSLMHANNEIGTLSDMAAISALCRTYGAYYHSDTVQTIGHFPMDLQAVSVDFVSGAAHKFHGPKGVGFIYIKNDNKIKPFIDGGAQERNMRGGTENLYGIVGMAKALELATQNMDVYQRQIQTIRDYFIQQLEQNFNDIQFNGDYMGKHLYTVLSVSFPPSHKNDVLMFNLDIAGISASGGSACSSGAEGGSHVLKCINADPDRKTIRFSFSHYNTVEEVDFVVEKLKAILPLSPKAVGV